MRESPDRTARVAKALWNDCLGLEPAEFQARFDAIYPVAEGPATLWYLGGAANDFLRCHPETIAIPCELAETLLSSPILDGRIIGLKLFARTCANLQAIYSAIYSALDSEKEPERCGGLYELSVLLDRLPRTTILPGDDLRRRLNRLKTVGPAYDRRTAHRLEECLDEFPQPSIRSGE